MSSLSSRKTITKTCLKYVIKIYGLFVFVTVKRNFKEFCIEKKFEKDREKYDPNVKQ